jgi:transposase-like protein
MNAKRKKFSPEEKARIALEALKGELTLSQITAKYGVHSTQIHNWKQRLKEGINDVFRDKRAVDDRDKDQLIEELYKQIGQLKVEMDWLKKKTVLFD